MAKTPTFNRRSHAEQWLANRNFSPAGELTWETQTQRAFIQQVLGGHMPKVQILIEDK